MEQEGATLFVPLVANSMQMIGHFPELLVRHLVLGLPVLFFDII